MGLSPFSRPLGSAVSVGRTALHILTHPQYTRDMPAWFTSCTKRLLDPSGAVFQRPLPSYSYPAIRWIEGVLTKDSKVFEYGSGGSTVYFAERVSKVVSVEHDAMWAAALKEQLEKRSLDNVQYIHAPPVKSLVPQYESARRAYKGMDFSDYVTAIDQFDEQYFDFAIIDGRCRAHCLTRALSRVRHGGWLILDNSERPRYASAMRDVSKSFDRQDYVGLGPFSGSVWSTTVWNIV